MSPVSSVSRICRLVSAVVLVLLLLPAAAGQQTPTRTVEVDVVVEDAGPEDAPYTLTLAPLKVPVDIVVTCSGPEVPAKLITVAVNAVVEDASGAPTEDIVVKVEPKTLEFTFPEQACLAEDEEQNETVEVTVTPGHVSVFDAPIRIGVSAVVEDRGINETAQFHVRTGLEGKVSLTFPTLTYETDVREAYEVEYKVLNDMNTEVKVTWGDVPEGLRHEVLPQPFVACNSHAEGCTASGLTGGFDVIPPEASDRVEEEVTLTYAITPAAGDDTVLEQGSTTLTLVYAPAGSGAGGDNEESPGVGTAFVLVAALIGLAGIRRRRS